MGINAGLMTSNSGEWETPQSFFDRLNKIYRFDLDAAASHENAKCSSYYTKEDDALTQPWPGRVWCNPPYGREVAAFVEKGWKAAQHQRTLIVVMLLPARTDTRWWHEWVMRAKLIYLVRGRLRFVGAPSSAPFPSAVALFQHGTYNPTFRAFNAKEG